MVADRLEDLAIHHPPQANATGIESKESKRSQIREAACDWKTYAFIPAWAYGAFTALVILFCVFLSDRIGKTKSVLCLDRACVYASSWT